MNSLAGRPVGEKGRPRRGPQKALLPHFSNDLSGTPAFFSSPFHQGGLRKPFPEEWGLPVTGRSWGLPFPSALIAKMSWWGAEGIRQMGAPPPPGQCHLPAPSPPPGARITLRDPGHMANDITPSRGLKSPHVRGPVSFSLCHLTTVPDGRGPCPSFQKVSVCGSPRGHGDGCERGDWNGQKWGSLYSRLFPRLMAESHVKQRFHPDGRGPRWVVTAAGENEGGQGAMAWGRWRSQGQ